jgi:hypothetical protein
MTDTTIDGQPLDGGLHPLLGKTLRELGWSPASPGSRAGALAMAAGSIRALLRLYDQNTCTHEETYRGGAIWTFCRGCSRQWADDQGGFEPYEEPKEVTIARDLLQMMDMPDQETVDAIRTFGAPELIPTIEWIRYDGRVFVLPGGQSGFAPMPVAPGTRVRIKYRDGDEIETDKPEWMRWGWTRPYVSCADIVAYRVLP